MSAEDKKHAKKMKNYWLTIQTLEKENELLARYIENPESVSEEEKNFLENKFPGTFKGVEGRRKKRRRKSRRRKRRKSRKSRRKRRKSRKSRRKRHRR